MGTVSPQRHTEVAVDAPQRRNGIVTYLKLIRVHQWIKNLLVLLPLFAARTGCCRLISSAAAGRAFLAFSFCASSAYILNDLMDVESDQQHFRKSAQADSRRQDLHRAGGWNWRRAVCRGRVPRLASVSMLFTLSVAIYFSMTLAYSLRLKRQVIVDVMLLAGLYTIRVLAGAIATIVVPSFWLLAFSMFLFLSLAMVKRYSEMLVTLAEDKREAAGRGYSVNDLPVLLSLGVSTGVAAIVVLALYINDPVTARLYPVTYGLWPIPPLMLYWISRVWMKAHRGEMHDDPVVFALRDWQSILIAIASAFFVIGAAGLI